jgi:hypothetical protein
MLKNKAKIRVQYDETKDTFKNWTKVLNNVVEFHIFSSPKDIEIITHEENYINDF